MKIYEVMVFSMDMDLPKPGRYLFFYKEAADDFERYLNKISIPYAINILNCTQETRLSDINCEEMLYPDKLIKVGDEIKKSPYGLGIVTRVYNGTLAVTWINGGTNGVVQSYSVERTGKHYDIFDEIIKQEE